MTWLASGPVQAFLESLVLKLFVTSLEAERHAAQVKMSLARKLSHIATVSRNLICAGYQRWRLAKAAAADQAAQRLRRAIRTNESALAWAHQGSTTGASRNRGASHRRNTSHRTTMMSEGVRRGQAASGVFCRN